MDQKVSAESGALYGLGEELVVTPDGPVRVLRMNRPHDLNGINRPLHQALAQVWDHIGEDTDARSVVVSGAGSAFSAGGDFGYMQENIDDEKMRAQTIAEGRAIIRGMIRCPLPVIAAVNGPAVGLGCSIAMLSDLVLMSEDSFLADPHLRMGLVPGDGGPVVWPMLIGPAKAKEFLFTGDVVRADAALEMGLVNHVYPPDQVDARALELAARIARGPAGTIQATKSLVNFALRTMGEQVVTQGLALERVSQETEYHHEAVKRFLAGDPVRF
jgi:enoyl-CoA hydratase